MEKQSEVEALLKQLQLAHQEANAASELSTGEVSALQTQSAPLPHPAILRLDRSTPGRYLEV